ncbi:MAG: EamA family transporter [Deltaproteobacteria bacterium]|nr:EamA family transporter [Deltaproteobacteria bacterium]
MHSQTFTTTGLTLIALIAFAANSIFCRLALSESAIDPASYTAVRLISGALTLWMIAGFLRHTPPVKSGGAWISATMLFLYAIAFSFAYLTLSAGTGALILFAAVQITMIGVGLYSGERPRPLEWLGLFVALAGLVYLVSPGISAPSPLGSALMAMAGIAWGVYSLYGRGAIDPVAATADNFLRAAPLALVVALLWLPALDISPMGFLWAALSGSISSGIGYVIWYAALRGLTATRAATVQLSVPVIAALGGVLFLAEEITIRLILSAVTILGGVALAVLGHKAVPGRQKI